MLEKQEKEPEGHPIDWAYPTRLLWTASHLTRLIYRPIVELENWYDEGPGSFKNIHSLQHRLDEVDPDRRLFSTLDILVLDLSRYEGALSARDAIEDHDYGDDDPHRRILATAYLIRQGQDGPYRDYINDFPALEDLLPLLAEGFRFKQTCIRRGPAYGRIFDLDTIKTDSITLHDFLGLRCGDYSGLELRAPEIVCSFISSFQAIASRLRAIDRVPQFITHEVRAIVLARPKGREKPYSRQMNFMTKHWENTGKRCKVNWRYLENAEDGVPRCKACGGMSGISYPRIVLIFLDEIF